jgi:hypothetical protein
MSFDVTILNFSTIYEQESFYQLDKSSHFIDLTDISGTNCMCDDMAKSAVAERIGSARGLHFIDNGNYHYISAIYLEQIKEPFSLVVLDHHPDMQRPMFDILSCGGWVLEVMEKNEFVRDIHVIGADRKLIAELDEEVREKVKFYDCVGEFAGSSFPIYLSVDKDVIREDDITTNWDQGEASAEEVISFIGEVMGASQGFIGADICGECAPDQEGCDIGAAIAGNDEFNRRVLELFESFGDVQNITK